VQGLEPRGWPPPRRIPRIPRYHSGVCGTVASKQVKVAPRLVGPIRNQSVAKVDKNISLRAAMIYGLVGAQTNGGTPPGGSPRGPRAPFSGGLSFLRRVPSELSPAIERRSSKSALKICSQNLLQLYSCPSTCHSACTGTRTSLALRRSKQPSLCSPSRCHHKLHSLP